MGHRRQSRMGGEESEEINTCLFASSISSLVSIGCSGTLGRHGRENSRTSITVAGPCWWNPPAPNDRTQPDNMTNVTESDSESDAISNPRGASFATYVLRAVRFCFRAYFTPERRGLFLADYLISTTRRMLRKSRARLSSGPRLHHIDGKFPPLSLVSRKPLTNLPEDVHK